MNPRTSLARLRRFTPLALVLVSTLVAVGAYLQALDYPFVSDDYNYLTKNTKLLGLHLAEVWRLFVEPYNGYSEFLPLRDLSYWFDIALFGLNPSALRLHNILLYLLCLPLVYGATFKLWGYFRPADAGSAPWAAVAVTALFALHPSHTEAVVWVAGRKDVLSGMFSLLALWFAVNARQEHGLTAPYAAAAMVALVAAMLSKATAIAVAPVVAMLWMIFWRGIPVPDRRHSLLLWPLASLLLAACTALIFAAATTQRIPFHFGVGAATQSLAALGWMARLAVSPESRHFYYPVFEDQYLPAMLALGATVLAAAAASAVVILRRRSLEGFALIAFLLLCMPYMQLIPYNTPSLVADRWLTLAVWPAMLLMVALSWRLKPVPRTALLLAIALPWGYQTIERPRDWRSSETIIDTDLRAYPGYYMPAFQKILWEQLAHGLNREALETANSITDPEIRNIVILIIYADAERAHAVNTGNPQKAIALLDKLGQLVEQQPAQIMWNPPLRFVWKYFKINLVNQWLYLAEYFPGDELVRYNTGLWMLNIDSYEDAAVRLRAATQSQRLPESMRGTAFKNLGLALLRGGHIAEAEAPLRAALEQPHPDVRAHCLLSEVYRDTKRLEEAARAAAICPSRAPGEKAVP